MRHWVLGLTGNVGAGKSTVAAMLRKLGARAIDSDITVRRLLDEDCELKALIAREFGAGVLRGSGIDRRALAGIVFADAAALARLERLIHPRVGRVTEALLSEATEAPATFIDAIKVVEGPSGGRLDGLWVVTAPDAVMIDRVAASGRLDESSARARLAVQSPAEAKISTFRERRSGRPVWRIANDGALADLQTRVAEAWTEVLACIEGGDLR